MGHEEGRGLASTSAGEGSPCVRGPEGLRKERAHADSWEARASEADAGTT